MRPEYQSLVMMSILFLYAFLPVSFGKFKTFGGKWLVSNRKPVQGKELEGWSARCERAHNNLKDNFPGFIAAILLLGMTNKFDDSTAIIAVVYVIARICHYISYGMGIVPLRAVFYFTGLLGNTYLLIKVLI